MLPYVLFVVSIVFILVTSSILLYRNDLYLTEHYLEHIRIETLFQRSQMKFNREILSNNSAIPSIVQYDFYDGKAIIHISEESDNLYNFVYIITTKELNFKYTFSYTANIASKPIK
jgi:hypothetical protein